LKFIVPRPSGPAIPELGISLSSRQLKRAEAEGKFPKRVPLYPGANSKGWPSIVIEEYLERLAEQSRM
jgi:predicted DNA-binding transcriptional regulator AlpA